MTGVGALVGWRRRGICVFVVALHCMFLLAMYDLALPRNPQATSRCEHNTPRARHTP